MSVISIIGIMIASAMAGAIALALVWLRLMSSKERIAAFLDGLYDSHPSCISDMLTRKRLKIVPANHPGTIEQEKVM